MKELNNKVELAGTILSEPEYGHSIYGEKFYTMNLAIVRESGTIDTLPLLVSDRLVVLDGKCIGKTVRVTGTYRSFNKHEEGKNKLLLFVFVDHIEETDFDNESDIKNNTIELDGFICKKPVYRETPLGREIADLLIAVNRSYGKTDYIPCICWGRNARYADKLGVGTHVKVGGRIQSRIYKKQLSETEYEERTAYEVSISRIEVIHDGKEEN